MLGAIWSLLKRSCAYETPYSRHSKAFNHWLKPTIIVKQLAQSESANRQAAMAFQAEIAALKEQMALQKQQFEATQQRLEETHYKLEKTQQKLEARTLDS